MTAIGDNASFPESFNMAAEPSERVASLESQVGEGREVMETITRSPRWPKAELAAMARSHR